MYAGGQSEMEELSSLQHRLQFDDPINIQFTSVCIAEHYVNQNFCEITCDLIERSPKVIEFQAT